MKFHKEGIPSLIIVLIFSALLIYVAEISGIYLLKIFFTLISAFLTVTILQFFRNPIRKFNFNENAVIAPADGKVVVIEKVFENEYLKKEVIQISIFMSPINVHINRNPISGVVSYFKYHPGKYLVAWHPKSSTENERTSVAIKNEKKGKEILFRQIAGALARRIVWYVKENDEAIQNEEFGFIKFGSRVDLFLPLDSKINVSIGQKVKGGITEISNF